MNLVRSFVLLLLLFSFTSTEAQTDYTVRLNKINLTLSENADNFSQLREDWSQHQYGKDYYVLIQFDAIPTLRQRDELTEAGIELLQYIPQNTYYAKISSDLQALPSFTRSVHPFPSDLKIEARLRERQIPVDAIVGDELRLRTTLSPDMTWARTEESLEAAGFRMMNDESNFYGTAEITAPADRIEEIAELPFIMSVEAYVSDKTSNYENVSAQRTTFLTAASGLNLSGQGVTIGLGDDGAVDHVDFNDRLTNLQTGTDAGNHGDHVIGTAAGGGLRNPRHRGFAPQATIIQQYFSSIRNLSYYNTYGMLFTNNSYSQSGDNCDNYGDYSFNARQNDLVFAGTPVLQVYAASNDGSQDCTPYPDNFANIGAGYASAKNILTVGAVSHTGGIAGFSSRGPATDGRIKPEICGVGTGVTSTIPTNNYGGKQGTSMATPSVTGTLALLSELSGNANGQLLKAIVCNTAVDKGNAGPDYKYGFGIINGTRAAEVIQDGTWTSNTVSQGGNNSFNLNVPANTAELRVMLYWEDPAAASGADPALINDLDLKVTDGSGTDWLPWVLDHTPANVNNLATRTVDHLNNIEQVTIDNPSAGNYTIDVAGFNIPSGSQSYYVVYSVYEKFVDVTYPAGGEHFTPGESERLRWDAVGGNESFTVSYSTDNGNTWNTINSNVNQSNRNLSWTVPSTVTGEAKIRVERNGTGISDEGNAFNIIGVPGNFSLTAPCDGYAQLDWNTVSGASEYVIYQKNGSQMQEIATVGTNTYLVPGLDTSTEYWFAVAAKEGTAVGRRTVADNITPSVAGACTWPVDMAVINIITNATTGRQFTGNGFGPNQAIVVKIKNLGTDPATNFPISYQINGGTVVQETVTQTIASGAEFDYTFSTTADMSAAGDYNVSVWTDISGDFTAVNDSGTADLRQIPNAPVTLPHTTDFESVSETSLSTGKIGLAGGEHLDFETSSADGRVRFNQSAWAPQGSKAATLDGTSGTPINYLIVTYNLSAHMNTALLLDFTYLNHGDEASTNDRVWIRGSENDTWIEVYNLTSPAPASGAVTTVEEIDITAALNTAGQSPSTSFQVRFGQEDNSSATSASGVDGLTFDNIVLYENQPRIDFTSTDISYAEGSITTGTEDCRSYYDMPVIVNSSAPPSGNTLVTFSASGSAGNTDYEILPPGTAVFPAGDNSEQTIYVRIFDDNETETSAENIAIDFTVSGVTNAVKRPGIAPLNINISDDDIEPGAGTTYILDEDWSSGDFSTNSWTVDGGNISVNSGSSQGLVAYAGFSWSPQITNYTQSITSAVLSAGGLSDLKIDFDALINNYDNNAVNNLTVEYKKISESTWTEIETFANSAISGNNTLAYNRSEVDLSALDNESFQIRVRFHGTDSYSIDEMGIDNIKIYGSFDITPQTALASISEYLGPYGKINYYSNDGNIMAVIENLSAQDHGCTTVEIDRVGTGAVQFTSANVQDFVTEKSIKVTPSQGGSTAQYRITLYYTAAEIAGWENTTGNSFTDFMILKTPADISDGNPADYDFGTNTQRGAYLSDYYVRSDFSSGFSGFAGSRMFDPTFLPVELLYFTGRTEGQQALLSWKTSQEINNEVFVLERSENGRDFYPISEIAGAGTTDEATQYEYLDKEVSNPVYYYRLLQKDFDGTFSYSSVIKLEFSNADADIQVNPNPFTDELLVSFKEAGERTLSLRNASGALVQQIKLEFDSLSHRFDAKDLPMGVYFLSVEGKENKTLRLVKTH